MRRILLIIPFLFFLTTAEAGYLDLAWVPNEEPDLGGYRIYYGTTSGEYIDFVDVGVVTTYRLDDLLDGVTFFLALTAYDLASNESGLSPEVSSEPFADETDGLAGSVAGGEKGSGCFVSALLMGS